MSAVFLDTVGILALLDEDDQWHGAALRAYDEFVRLRRKTVTTEFILLECGNSAARRSYRTDIADLRREMMSRNAIAIVAPDELEQAWAAYRSGQSGNASIVDCTSFVVMRRLGITDSFTNDCHFATAGFVNLF